MSFRVIEEAIRSLHREQKLEEGSERDRTSAVELTDLIDQAAKRAGIVPREGSGDLPIYSCLKCGAVQFESHKTIKGVKCSSGLSPPQISPVLLLEGMYADQAEIARDNFHGKKTLDLVDAKSLSSHLVALSYSKQRDDLVDRIYQLASRFNQRQRTKHVAVDIMDHFFLNKRAQAMVDIQCMSPRMITVFLTTCFLLASKFDEIDDKLVFINDVQKYYRSIDLDSRLGTGPVK